MALGKRLINTGGEAACLTETTDIFGDSSGKALYSMDYDASDTSGVYNGTPTDVDFGVSGKTVNGARFNGSSSIIALPSSSPFGDDDTIKSISAWVKLTTTSSIGVVYTVSSSTNASDYFSMQVRGDLNKVFIASRNGSTSNSFLDEVAITPDTNFHHYVFQLGSTEREIYIDGVKKTLTKSNAGTATDTSWISYPVYDNTIHSDIGLGRRSSAYYSAMTLDQVRMFSRVLTGTEISTLYNSGNGETACVHTSTTDDINFPVTNAAYYKLDNSAEDSKGTADGTETNIEYRFGRYGQAAVFNGSSSRINLPVGLGTTGARSNSLWIKVDTFPSSSIETFFYIGTQGANENYETLSVSSTSKVKFQQRVGSATDMTAIESNETIIAGNWYHIATTHDGTTAKLYINGDLSKGGSVSFSSYVNNSSLAGNLGAFHTLTPSFDGSIDQYRRFHTALSAANVTSLYNEKPETDTSNFKTVLYEGTSATQYISNVGMDLETGGGLVWIKNRDTTDSSAIVDNVRGIATTGSNYIASDASTQEASSTNMPSSLEKNGFFVQGSGGRTNTNNESYVSWVWKGAGDAVSNDNGSNITSSASANVSAGFSIVKWTGDGNSSSSVGHGLTVNGENMLVFIKDLDDSSSDWMVLTNNLWTTPQQRFLKLNTDAAVATSGVNVYNVDNTTFKNAYRNTSSNDYIGYCFHSVSGYQKISSYSAGSVGLRIYTTDDGTSSGSNGFRPSFVMIKNTTIGSTNWLIVDSKRPDKWIYANVSDADATVAGGVVLQDDGFSLGNQGSYINASGSTYIYLAVK